MRGRETRVPHQAVRERRCPARHVGKVLGGILQQSRRHREIPDSVLDPKRDPSDSPRNEGLRSRSTQERRVGRDIKRPACVTKKTGKELP